MAGSILVVGLSGQRGECDWSELLDGRTILARSGQIATAVLPSAVTIEHAYDELFDRAALTGPEHEIAEDVILRSAGQDVAYLVPGPGWIADATVEALRGRAQIEIAPSGQPPTDGATAYAQVIDALVLAQAGEAAPFDAGLSPLHATVPTVVYNWHGLAVIEQATQRLQQTYGMTSVPPPTNSGVVIVPARDELDGPPSFAALAQITARLRRLDGCPWDREQTHESMLDDFASEVEEYAEAVRAADWPHAAEELGDVLLNVLMQAQIGTEAGHFRIEDVLAHITAKLVRRHPHVFAGVEVGSADDVLAVWNSVKQQERKARSNSAQPAP